ncbi:MAG: sulfide/dihydroorotate dehydrogenase-like FAD/NAD-binding protein [Candidatus Hadarchaeaceae archaeon]
MARIISKKEIAPHVFSLMVQAPLVAKKAKPGQFLILMVNEKGERIPLTIADFDRERGTIRMVFEVVGKTTAMLSKMNEGDELFSLVGPLGIPSEICNYGTVIVIGGGIGVAPAYPIARELKAAGNRVIGIIGARKKELLIMEEEMRRVTDRMLITTDDGSYGQKGFVTGPLAEILQSGERVKKVWAIGPAVMMKAVCDVTRPYNVETITSLNATMLDGTGMCGTCRVSVGGQTKFACVDGPEFNGHLVDWVEFINRLSRYKQQEKLAYELYKKSLGE